MTFETFFRIIIVVIALFVYVIVKAYNKAKTAENNEDNENTGNIKPISNAGIDGESSHESSLDNDIYLEKELDKTTIFQSEPAKSSQFSERKTLIETKVLEQKKRNTKDSSALSLSKEKEIEEIKDIDFDLSLETIIQGVLYKEILERRGGRK